MIAPVVRDDLPEIRELIAFSIRDSVAESEDDARFLISDVDATLEKWEHTPDHYIHLKHISREAISGVILVKDFWNLSVLFVDPSSQGVGIGKALVSEILERCRSRSPRQAVLVNSSSVAVGFYRRLGFQQLGPGVERPGGCVPFGYQF